jgi:hypothetical protein
MQTKAPNRALGWCFVWSTAAYLALGNLPRFLPLGPFKSNILLSEAVFYLLGMMSLVASRKRLGIPIEMVVIPLLILCSYLIGVLKYGYDIVAMLYGVRFSMMALCCTALGFVLFERYGNRADLVLRNLVIYPILVSTLIGWLLFFLFPDAAKLWLALQLVGITFSGDPHSRRLLSAYFDPNYYCVVVIFGAICALLVYQLNGRRTNLLLAIFFVVSALFTVSRSGLAQLFMVAGAAVLIRGRQLRITKAGIFGFACAIIALAAAFPVLQEALERAVLRFQGPSTDLSTMARVYSAHLAMDVLQKNLLFGIGFNYVPHLYSTITSFDASLLMILATMGLVGALLFLSINYLFVARAIHFARRAEASILGNASSIGPYLTLYIVTTVLFSSNFNNILFYQFWFVPVFVVLNYFYFLGRARDVRRTGPALAPPDRDVATIMSLPATP